MMPLSAVNIGENRFIKAVGGRDETRKFLASLGFVPSSRVAVVSKLGGNMIINIKNSRIAISRDIAADIMV